jgi:hypothetical protein
MLKSLPAAIIVFCLLPLGFVLGQADDPETLAFVAGGATGKIFRIDTTGTVEIFSANRGFRAESLALDGAGRIFVCDSSNSEIHILEQAASGDWELTTIYDKDSAVSPSPEQPIGCGIVGPDLFIGERSGSGGNHGVWVIRDAASTPTSGPFNPPVLLAAVTAVSGDKLSDITFGSDAHVYVALGNRILVAAPPSWDSLELFADELSGEVTGLAVNSVGEIFAAMADLGIVEAFDGDGVSCGIYADVSPLRPAGLQFDLSDNLYIAAPKRSNGRAGDVFVAAPNAGPATHQCDFEPPTVAVTSLSDPAPDAEVDVTLPLSSVSQELFFDNADPLTAKLCAALFTIDPDFLNDPQCPVTLTCRMMPQEEFQQRTDAPASPFSSSLCMDIPNGNGNCIEMGIEGSSCLGGTTELEWLFFATTEIGPEDRPGLLYSVDAGPTTTPYTANVLTEYQAVVPDLPNDPGMKAKLDIFGTGLVGVTGAPNRPPVADAGADQTVGCDTASVTIDGSASFDLDPIDDALSFAWTGPAIPAGAEDDPSFDVDVAVLGPGEHSYTLVVTDPGQFSDEGPLSSDPDTVTITIEGGTTTIEALSADPGSLWPPNHEMVSVEVTADASSDCGTVSCRIVSVESTDPTGAPDDPDSGNGAGTYPDWSFTGPLTLDLRAERSEGGDSVDDTRVYTITVSCSGAAGNSDEQSVEVWVVSDQGG